MIRSYPLALAFVLLTGQAILPSAWAGESENARDATAEIKKLKESYKKVDEEVRKIVIMPTTTAHTNRKLLERTMAGAQALNKKVTALWKEAQAGGIKDAMQPMVDLQKKAKETEEIIKAKAKEIQQQRLAEAAKAKSDKALADAKKLNDEENAKMAKTEKSQTELDLAAEEAKTALLKKEIADATTELASVQAKPSAPAVPNGKVFTPENANAFPVSTFVTAAL